MWHFPSARFAPFCTPDTRSFIHTARYVDGRSEHDACGIRDETTETANSWRKQCRELCQNCAKTLSNCNVGAYFEREADSPKLLQTLESESKGRNRWNAGSCLQSTRLVSTHSFYHFNYQRFQQIGESAFAQKLTPIG